MFSHCYQIGESIEIYNSHDKNLFSKWGFTGKHSKVYDPNLHTYEMVLSTGNISKMEIPKKSYNKNKSLSLFQGYIVFQLYLFTSKQLTIEIAISDTTNAKRRLILSTNNSDLVMNQLHCRIPIFKLPIGRWINFSIDILSFVSKYKNLTFRSVDYISLSMSGKVRYIFTMRTPLIETNNNFELDEEGNIINYNNNSNLDMDLENNDSKLKDNSENNFSPGAKDIPDKYKFPPSEEIINMNIDCNKVFSQIYLENQNKQIKLSQKEIFNNKGPILIQDTANANNMDKSLKFRHQYYIKQKRINKNGLYDNYNFSDFEFRNNNLENNNNENHYMNNVINYLKNNLKNEAYNKSVNRFNKVGNLIMSHNVKNKNFLNKKSTYNLERNNIKLDMNNNNIYENININNDIEKNELKNEKEFINLSKEDNNNERYNHNLFNKEEYNQLYNNGKGVTNQIKKNLKLENNNENKIKDFDTKMNFELSPIKNSNLNINDNYDFYNNKLEKDTMEYGENNDNSEDNERPFSPPITKLDDNDF